MSDKYTELARELRPSTEEEIIDFGRQCAAEAYEDAKAAARIVEAEFRRCYGKARNGLSEEFRFYYSGAARGALDAITALDRCKAAALGEAGLPAKLRGEGEK